MFELGALFSSKRKKVSIPEIKGENLSVTLFMYLYERITRYSIHYELKSKIKLHQRYSEARFQQEFPSLYLDIEEFLLLQESYAKKDKQDFRDELLIQFPDISNQRELYVIFLDYNHQKVGLSRLFLSATLLKAKDLLGNFQDNYLKESDKDLKNPYSFLEIKSENFDTSQLKRLYDTSTLLQKKLEESLGKNAMLSIYTSAYNSHFNNYYLLESFTTTIHLVPEELLIAENANMPSKGQMHRLLKTQISALEDINLKLSKEVIERKNIQKELEVNERLYSAVLHNSLNANIIMNPEGGVIRANAQAKALFGEGCNFYNLLPKDVGELLKTNIQNLQVSEIKNISKETINFEIVKNEENYYFRLKASPIFMDQDLLFFCVVDDVTKEMESLVLIKESKNIAEKSAKAKTTFLSNMSHEIRTPLNIILGLSDLFSKENYTGSPEEFDNINIIKFSAENLLTLVNDILDFSKIEAGKMSVQSVDFNCHEIINNLTSSFTYKATEKGLVYTTKLDPSIPKFIVGDQYRLSQILNNLLSNALKFTREGKVSFEINLVEKVLDTVKLKFIVRDTGVGIPAQNLDNIYDSFYQTLKENENKPEGTGLGLSISKQLVELLGGKLNVESTLNVGTTFSFELSYQISSLSNMMNGNLNTADEKQLFKGKNILVAEDNKLNQLFIQQLFKRWEVNVTFANNGEETIKVLEKQDYDLILMDIHMPICNGLEATKIIRKHPNSIKRNIPIVACSADVFPESRKQAEDAGVNYYMTKPVNTNSVKEILILFTQ